MFQQIFKLSFVFFNAYVQNYWREAGGGGGLVLFYDPAIQATKSPSWLWIV